MAVDKKISELAFGTNARNNLITIVENGVNKKLYLQSASKRFDILNKTQDYNIKQSDYRNLIIGNCNQNPYGDLNLYLPAGANAIIGYPYQAQHGIYQGFVKVNVKGGSGNKILYKGQELDYFLLYSKGQKVEFLWDGNYWIPEKKSDIIMDVGWYGNASWAARELGNAVTYDNKSVASSLTGQLITEEISGFSAVVIYDDTINSILYYYELSAGFTFFTNNRELTSSSGITCDVNEASGSNKNIDYKLYDGSGVNILYKNIETVINSSASFNSSFKYNTQIDAQVGTTYGLLPNQVSSNSNDNQTGSGGLRYIDSAGNPQVAGDWFIRINIII